MTYRESYQEFVESQISRGGEAALMDQCVSEYNRLENPAYGGSPLYTAWIRTAVHECSGCNGSFQHKKEADVLPVPSAAILCQACTDARSGDDADRLNDAGGRME